MHTPREAQTAPGRRPLSREGRRGIELAAGGLASTALCILVEAVLDVSLGRLHVIAALALVGLLAVAVGGVFAAIAIVEHRERSPWVLGVVPLSLLALLVVVSELAVDVP